jgi:hypothetical protein
MSAWCRLSGKPIDLWDHQRQVLDLCMTGKGLVILKARQLGVSEVIAMYVLWFAMTNPNSQSMLISIGDRESVDLLARLEALYDSMPAEVRNYASKKGPPNQHILRLGNSIIRSLPAGAGRAFKSDLLVLDEAARWENADERMADLMPTAADSGQTIISSTARGIGNMFWRQWAQTRPNTNRIFIPATARPTRTRQWVEQQRNELMHLGPQEYPLTSQEAFLSSGVGILDTSGLSWMTEHMARTGTRYEISAQGAVRDQAGRWTLWQAPEPGRDYILAADSSGGGAGSDPSAACIYDVGARCQVGAFWGRVPPHVLARQLANAGLIYNTALIAPEANDHGKAVVAHLADAGYPRIYESERFDTARGGVSGAGQLGWVMSRASKHTAVGALGSAIYHRTVCIRDVEAISEMTMFGEIAPGKFAAISGHDDRVIAHAIAIAIMDHSALTGGMSAAEAERPYWMAGDVVTGY